MDLFTEKKNSSDKMPLSVRMRPKNLEDFVGQRHIIGKGKLLRRAIESDRISSLILYGPAGVGKTTIAHIVANKTKAHFERINAVLSGVDELRRTMERARLRKKTHGEKTIIFIDEIHRFNKAQQDVLMPDLEEGSFILIGATVHNPFFYLTSPLLSRSLVFELQSLKKADVKEILQNSLEDKKNGLGEHRIKCDDRVLEFLANACEGDARRALNALEIGVETTSPNKRGIIHFDLDVAQDSIQKKALRYDRDGDEHYDTISAFIKSMRGSDPDAALYWMAKMLNAGEDPRFIARRICICAAEDVGNADPMATVLAQAAFSVADFVGMPEARIPLAQAAIYVACAPKSNACYLGIDKAMKEVEKERVQEVPQYLKDASYKGAEKLNRGKGYKYAHDYPNHFVQQKYTKRKISFYDPQDIGYEKKIKERLNLFYNSKTAPKEKR
ncbi:MAG: replication-associated recombination protein A [Candidatus Omnitrophota bacterium]